jgi:hypothetical protein
MMVVRAFPNTAGAEDQNAKDPHQALGEPGMRQYGLMLLIVINDKEPKVKQAGENTADDFAGQMEVPESPRQGAHQEKRSGKYVPPTPHRGIERVRLGCQYDLFSRSHAGFKFDEV